MYPSVQSQFRKFNEAFEGVVPHMYADIKQLITVGVGNLIDPVELALGLPFRFKSRPGILNPGTPASKDQIAAEWQRIKNDKSLAKKGHKVCASLTELELPDEALDRLINKRLTENESYLKRQQPFRDWDSWPADAQLAVLSMAWALGPGGVMDFSRFCAACSALDFNTAAKECKMSEAGNPGVKPRNIANARLLRNAAIVQAAGQGGKFDRAALYYPRALMKAASA